MKSMTGFGTAERQSSQGTVHVEMRSYNHRFLDLRLKLHRDVLPLEARIHAWARKRLERGRVEIRVQRDDRDRETVPLRFHPEALRFYLETAGQMRDAFGLPGELDVPSALRLKEVVSPSDERPDTE